MNDGPARHFEVEIVRTRPLSPTVRSFLFRAAGDASLRWNAGQYIELEVLPGQRKPYSIASAMGAHGPDQFEIAVTLAAGGEVFESFAPGKRLSGFGPSGGLRRPRSEKPSAFLAVGTGLSPFRAMIQDELARGGAAPLLLLFGCRNESDILWRDELAELALRYPRFRFEPTLSKGDASWSGRRGWVQDHFEELLTPLARAEADFYVCGVSAMVSDCVRRLENGLGATRDRIFTERC